MKIQKIKEYKETEQLTVKMATIGRVPEFEATKEDFDSYLERFERWLAANEIKDGKKADVFLSVLGPTEYGLLKGLIEPMKAVELNYAELTETLARYFKPKPILIAERFRFYQRHQSQGETVADYILALKRLASTCDHDLIQEVAVDCL
uniref:Retrotransposon gag domain-containing protein n=1 Tax=Oncorhynchus kisutch TaxID=8019 RepID=A0A8C7L8Y6_ONCKI